MRRIVIDTETTGVDPEVDRVCEIAMLDIDTGQSFSSLCNPGREIPPEAMAIHHIRNEDVADKPDIDEVMYRGLSELFVLPFDPICFIAHNAKFDRDMLLGQTVLPELSWICTYKMSLIQYPSAPGHSNQVLRYWLNLNPQVPADLAPHRALYDVIVTAEIFRDLLTTHTVEDMIVRSSNPVLLPTCTFGKHKGKPFAEVDSGYLSWMLKQPDMDENKRYTAEFHLARRAPALRRR